MTEQSPVVLGAPRLEDHGTVVRWTVPLKGLESFSELWFDVPTEFAGLISDRSDAAVLALTIPLLRLNRRLVVEGPVTDEIAFKYADLQALYGATGHGRPMQASFQRPVPSVRDKAAGAAAGFSGGVDSFALLAEYYFADNVPDEYRITHLLFNNVGSHGAGGESLWRRRFERLRPAAEQIGLPFIPVNSNVSSIPSGTHFEVINGPTNAAVGLLLSGGLSHWIFASSSEFRRIGVKKGAYNTAFVDPIALPLMSSRNLTLQTSASRFRRFEKVRMIADIPQAWESLDVCVRPEPSAQTNCTRCPKCLLTLAALDLVGAEQRFAGQFDLPHWYEVRERYLASVRFADTALTREIAELMEEVGYVPRKRLSVEQAALMPLRRGTRAIGRTLPPQVQRAIKSRFGA